MGKNNSRQFYFADGKRIPSGINFISSSGLCSDNEGKRKPSNFCYARGSQKTSSKGGNRGSAPVPKPVYFTAIPGPEKDGRLTTSDKSKTVKQVYFLQPFQDGKSADSDSINSSRRLHGDNRSKGRLFFDSNLCASSQISSFHLGGSNVSVHGSSVRVVQRPESLYKGPETGSSLSTSHGHKMPHLHRRSVDHGRIGKRVSRTCQVDSTFSFNTQFQCKYGKISFNSVNKCGVPRFCSKLKTDGSISSGNQVPEDFEPIKSTSRDSRANRSPGVKHFRSASGFTMGDTSGNSVLPQSSGKCKYGIEKLNGLQRKNEVIAGGSGRASTVVFKPPTLEWEGNDYAKTACNSTDGCFAQGMGSYLCNYRRKNKRPVVKHREGAAYKCSRALGSVVCNPSAGHTEVRNSCLFENGQFNRSVLYKSSGRDKVSSVERYCKRSMGVGSASSGEHFSRIPSRCPESDSRCSFEAFQREPRMVAEPQHFSPTNRTIGFSSSSRPVCLTDECSGSTVCVLAARSSSMEDRCISNSVVKPQRLRVSTVLSRQQSSRENRLRSSAMHAGNSTSVGNTALVSSTAKNVGSQTNFITSTEGLVTNSAFARNSSLAQLNVSSRVACVSQHLSEKGIPFSAARLMLASWRKGTQRQYAGAWKEWVRWCEKGEVNPLSATIGDISLFLTTMHNKGLSYSTVNTYRSAISMTHLPMDGVPVGTHYLIRRLMKGIFNERPPVPRYVITWRVDKVLSYLKLMPENSQLSLKLLSCKTAILIALVSADRGDAISSLNLEYMTKDSSGYHFLIAKATKCTRPGKGIRQIDLPKFRKDRRVCVSSCLDTYLRMTKELRGDEKQLFISYVRPHRRVTTPTVARWIKLVMKTAGLDVSMFRPHSTRSAATSAAFQKGVSIADILKKADWARATTFHRYYNRPKVNESFVEAILTSR